MDEQKLTHGPLLLQAFYCLSTTKTLSQGTLYQTIKLARMIEGCNTFGDTIITRPVIRLTKQIQSKTETTGTQRLN